MNNSIAKFKANLMKTADVVESTFSDDPYSEIENGKGKFSLKSLLYHISSTRFTQDDIVGVKIYKGFKTSSQSIQDLFAAEFAKSYPTYVDIGACYPIHISNSFTLETFHDWIGFSIEIDENLVNEFNLIRKNKCACGDATTWDYQESFSNLNLPKNIGYLSVDVDPAWQSLRSLAQIPFESFNFAFITFEHDSYKVGDTIQQEAFDFLTHLGYKRVVKNVLYLGRFAYEDWYVHPDLIEEKLFFKYESKNISGHELFLKKNIFFRT